MKFKNWLSMWSNTFLKNKVKPRTFKLYQDFIRLHILPQLGHYDLNQLNPYLLQDFINQKAINGNIKTAQPLSSNTLLILVSILKQSLLLAFLFKHIKKDCFSFLKVQKKSEKTMQVFSLEEQKKLEKYCLSKKNQIILAFF